jgi:hypothetical protein
VYNLISNDVTNNNNVETNILSARSLTHNNLHPNPTPLVASSATDLLTTNICIEGNGDSGSSGHYLPICCEDILLEVRPTITPITVTCADGSSMVSTKTAVLDLPSLPISARTCHLFPNITGALLSIGNFCDNGMTAVFDKTKVEIRSVSTGDIVLAGRRDNRGMYMLPLTQPDQPIAQPSANVSIYSFQQIPPMCTASCICVRCIRQPRRHHLISSHKSNPP